MLASQSPQAESRYSSRSGGSPNENKKYIFLSSTVHIMAIQPRGSASVGSSMRNILLSQCNSRINVFLKYPPFPKCSRSQTQNPQQLLMKGELFFLFRSLHSISRPLCVLELFSYRVSSRRPLCRDFAMRQIRLFRFCRSIV